MLLSIFVAVSENFRQYTVLFHKNSMIHVLHDEQTRPHFLYSTQLRMNLIMLLNVKLPKGVGILTFLA